MTFQPVTQTRVSVLIADAICSSIRESTLSAGDWLPPIEEIARSLYVSIPSVRKALSLLSTAGMVTIVKYRGTVVNAVRNLRVNSGNGENGFHQM